MPLPVSKTQQARTGDNRVEKRMQCAMEDAAAEMDDEDNGESDSDDENGTDEEIETDEGSGENQIDEEMEELDTENDSEVEEDDGEVIDSDVDEAEDEDQPKEILLPLAKPQSKYLDDGLFASAYAHAKADATPAKSPQKILQPARKRHRRRPLTHAKDILVGTRTIRTLPNSRGSQVLSAARTIPSQKVRKFIDRCLAIKGKRASAKAKARGWERRPANVGVMKCTGAPSGFVRSRQ